MIELNSYLIISLLCLSLLFSFFIIIRFFLAIGRFIQKKILVRTDRLIDIKFHSSRSRLLKVTLLLIGAVWCIRFAVGYYSIFFPADANSTVLSPTEEIFNSLVHTLQTFSLDEDYVTYITKGKEMINTVVGDYTLLTDIYGIYVAILNFAVPLAGGALLFELISEFFPRVHMFFANLVIWKDKYYFSELNDKSLAIAKSIMTSAKAKPFLIFTDTYTDEEEFGTERLVTAKTLGGICVKDDLLHIRFARLRHIRIFLIDESESENMQALASLMERSSSVVRKSEIYIFSSDKSLSLLDKEAAFIVEQKIEKTRKENFATKRAKKAPQEFLPAVLPINGVRHLALNLFMYLPLFEPIIDKKPLPNGRKKLNVTILGSGAIGTEFFLTTYWCAQMSNTDLHINVVSNEKRNKNSEYPGEGDFEGKINNINPEIFKTADENSPLLKCSDITCQAERYFTYSYYESDVMLDDLCSLIETTELADTDYFIVALGSDEVNFTVADKLRRIVGKNHLISNEIRNTVITYIIYNPDLCKSLNNNCFYKYSKSSVKSDLLMMAFGNLEEVYSVRNIFFEGISEVALHDGELFNLRKTLNSKTGKLRKSESFYSYSCDFSKIAHRKYKEYSAGFHSKSLFEYTDYDDYFSETAISSSAAYIRNIALNNESEEKRKELAWLEHRRWCANMRTKGFRQPNGISQSAEVSDIMLSLKIHPELFEYSKDANAASDFDYPENDLSYDDIKLLLKSDDTITDGEAKYLKKKYSTK